MPINFNGANVGAVSYGSQGISEVYHGRDLVWQADKRETVVIPEDVVDNDVGNFLSEALYERNFSPRQITEFPFKIDSSKVTRMDSAFLQFESLQIAPELDTSNVTNMDGMFMHLQALRFIPDLDTSNVERMNYMLFKCRALTDGNVRLIRKDGTLPEGREDLILNSGLTRQPFFDANGNPIP